MALGLVAPILLATYFPAQHRAPHTAASKACAPDSVAVTIDGAQIALPFDRRLFLSPAHRRHQLHALRSSKGARAYCHATDQGAKPFAASRAYLFSGTRRGDALCPATAGSPAASLCPHDGPPIKRIALALRDGDSLSMATTGEDFAANRARDPWKSQISVPEAQGRVTRYADEYRSIDRPGKAPLIARCWLVGALIQCDASEMLAPRLRLEWTIVAAQDEIGAALVAADARASGFLAAIGLP